MNDRKRPRAVIPRRPSGHATTRSLWLKKNGLPFRENRDKEGSFEHTTSFAANDIPSVSGKGGLNSAYPSDFYICRPLTLPFQTQRSSIR